MNSRESFREWVKDAYQPSHMLLMGEEFWMDGNAVPAPGRELEHVEKLKMYEEVMEEKILAYVQEVRRAFEIDVPALQGSLKQRMWAEKIRCQKMDEIAIFSTESRQERDKKRKEMMLIMVNKLEAINAKYWIENAKKKWKELI